jgi:uncharacterized membrane protein YdbT with pleckstrin-like domain
VLTIPDLIPYELLQGNYVGGRVATAMEKTGYIEKNLAEGETLVYRTGCHSIVMLWPLVAAGALGFFGLLMFAGGWLANRRDGLSRAAAAEGAIFLTIAAALASRGIIRRIVTEVAVSNQRIIIRTGLLTRKTFEVLLPRVESIGIKETLMGRMLGYGTVMVRGIGGTCESFEKIRRPEELKRQVGNQLSAAVRHR